MSEKCLAFNGVTVHVDANLPNDGLYQAPPGWVCPSCGTCPTCGSKKTTDSIPTWPWPYQTWPSVPVDPPTFYPWWQIPPVTCHTVAL